MHVGRVDPGEKGVQEVVGTRESGPIGGTGSGGEGSGGSGRGGRIGDRERKIILMQRYQY